MSQRGPSVAPGRPNATTRVQCDRKKNCGPNGACRVRVQGNICESNFWQLLKVEFCKYVEKCLRWKLIWQTPTCTQTVFTCIHYWSGIQRVSVQSHIVDIYETIFENNFASYAFEGVLQMTIKSSFINNKTWYVYFCHLESSLVA